MKHDVVAPAANANASANASALHGVYSVKRGWCGRFWRAALASSNHPERGINRRVMTARERSGVLLRPRGKWQANEPGAVPLYRAAAALVSDEQREPPSAFHSERLLMFEHKRKTSRNPSVHVKTAVFFAVNQLLLLSFSNLAAFPRVPVFLRNPYLIDSSLWIDKTTTRVTVEKWRSLSGFLIFTLRKLNVKFSRCCLVETRQIFEAWYHKELTV